MFLCFVVFVCILYSSEDGSVVREAIDYAVCCATARGVDPLDGPVSKLSVSFKLMPEANGCILLSAITQMPMLFDGILHLNHMLSIFTLCCK